MKEFISAVEEKETRDEGDKDSYIEFKVDGRVLRSYRPTTSQLTFMLATLGRGQKDSQRFGSLINLLVSTLRRDDADYLEGRLLDPDNHLPMEVVESILTHLTGEWFARPSESQSDSAPSE